MLKVFSRLALITLLVLVAAVFIPQAYWLIFAERVNSVSASYSPVNDRIIISHYTSDGMIEWTNTEGMIYTREEVDSLLPLQNYRLLAAKGRMPDSLRGIAIDLDAVRLNNVFMRIRGYQLTAPQIPLYPLMESNPPRLKLDFPETFFRINDRMEFIVTETNTLDEEQTELYTGILKEQGFVFPAKNIFGNVTTKKPFDEGYFIVDNEGKVFHVKKRDGKPVCVKTDISPEYDIQAIVVSEMSLQEFYGVVIMKNSDTYLLMYDNYRLQKLPLENYDYTKCDLLLRGTLFHRTVSSIANNQIDVLITDREYNVVDRYQEKWADLSELTAGTSLAYFVPFEIDMLSIDSIFTDFYISDYHINSLIVNILLMIAAFVIYRRKRNLNHEQWIDYLIILVTGVYGFIAVLAVQISE
jgi:hypothetical protein